LAQRYSADREWERGYFAQYGLMEMKNGNLAIAKDYYERALPIIKQSSDKIEEEIILGSLGTVNKSLGERNLRLSF